MLREHTRTQFVSPAASRGAFVLRRAVCTMHVLAFGSPPRSTDVGPSIDFFEHAEISVVGGFIHFKASSHTPL